MTKHILWNM